MRDEGGVAIAQGLREAIDSDMLSNAIQRAVAVRKGERRRQLFIGSFSLGLRFCGRACLTAR
ncbi:MAG TPA: hypothetical protein VHO84_10465 [Syntrophorhabdaceae bacterium]|nr:hypothetical protein [Syntrophorhabdaceae bacterium]